MKISEIIREMLQCTLWNADDLTVTQLLHSQLKYKIREVICGPLHRLRCMTEAGWLTGLLSELAAYSTL